MKKRCFIFGYGSLLDKESRTRTTPKAIKGYPAILKGYTRGWFTRRTANGLSSTNLGIIKDEKNNKNKVYGLIYEVELSDLPDLDKREINFTRIKVDNANIDCLDTFLVDKNIIIYTYLSKFDDDSTFKTSKPCNKQPIVQSYVDLCMNGCIELEEEYPQAKEIEFIKRFIQSTRFWSKHWVNDRIYPRRPVLYCKNADKIDGYLKEYLFDKTIFERIKIE